MLTELERELKKALEDSAQHVALVLKGIRQGVMQDAAMIDTNLDAPTLEVRPISKMLKACTARSIAALAAAERKAAN